MNNTAKNNNQCILYSFLDVDLLGVISSFLDLSSVWAYLQTTAGIQYGVRIRSMIQNLYLRNNFRYLTFQRESGHPELLDEEDNPYHCSEERKARISSVRSSIQSWMKTNKNWKSLYEKSLHADSEDSIASIKFVLGDVHWLSHVGLLDVIRYLIKERLACLDKTEVDNNECWFLDLNMQGMYSPLWMALLAPDTAVFEYFLEQKCLDLSSALFDGGNILHDAASCNKLRPDCLLRLLKAVQNLMDVNQHDKKGLTPLHILIRTQSQHPHLVAKTEHFLDIGMDPYAKDAENITPLQDIIRLVQPPLLFQVTKLFQKFSRKRRRLYEVYSCN